MYEIRIDGLISANWSDWFEGLTIQPAFDEVTIFRGVLADQAALLGILAKLHSLNLKIISVTRVSVGAKLDASKRD